METSYKKNHLISELLLKRFAGNKDGLMIHHLKLNKDLPGQAGREGFVTKLWTQVSKRTMEQLWSDEAENYMQTVLAKIDNQQPLNDSDARLIARFCAIHFVRSKEFISLYEQILQRKADAAMEKHLNENLEFREKLRLGILDSGKIPGEFFERTLLEQYQLAKGYLEGKGIEIRYSTEQEELILPDGGLLVADATAGKYMASGGVALREAGQAGMVLGPKVLMGFNDSIKGVQYIPMNDRSVTNANSKLLYACRDRYYSRTNTEPKFT